jgi:release factor glutamine methyltransferase
MKKEPIRVVLESLAQPVYKLYSSVTRSWDYQGMHLTIFPGIFHPGWFATSAMLLEFLESAEIAGKSILEMSCGAGALACRAAQLNAISYASDISREACNNTELNASKNDLSIEVIQSDIFDQFSKDLRFDYIFANPPFKPRYPESEDEFSFCCGEEFEYFTSLFDQLRSHLSEDGKLIMVLSKSCNLEKILKIAELVDFQSERIQTKRKWSETNYLYSFSC